MKHFSNLIFWSLYFRIFYFQEFVSLGVCLVRSLSRQEVVFQEFVFPEFVFPEFVFQEFVFQEFVTAPPENPHLLLAQILDPDFRLIHKANLDSGSEL